MDERLEANDRGEKGGLARIKLLHGTIMIDRRESADLCLSGTVTELS